MELTMQDTYNQKQWLTPKEAVKEYGIGLSTWAKYRLRGRGPAFAKLGEKVLYNRADIEAWLKSKRVANTSQHAA
jgi:predicted DNA-binding transcriptional regulator AlpA